MNNRSYVFVLVLVCAAIFFPHLKLAEVNIMEARNFITAREMLQYDNWIHTTMNLLPRYEKPPLPTWLTALSGSIFGIDNLFGLRLPAALSATFLILTFYFFCVKVLSDKKQSFIASLILSSSLYVIFMGRNGQWDVYTHAFMTFAIFKLFEVFQSNAHSWKNWLLIGLFLGFSAMSKGPVSFFVLLTPFLISYGIVYKFKGFNPKILPVLTSTMLFLLVGLTWAVYIYFTDTSTAEYIANKETASWSNREVKPFYHYWSFFTQSGIWAFFALIALIYPFMIKRVENKKVYIFSLCWTLSAVFLLSLVPEKKERYLFPVLIPLALNTSFYIQYIINNAKTLSKLDRGLTNFGFGLVAIISISFPFLTYFYFEGHFDGYWTSFFFSAISLLGLGILMLIWLRKRAYEYNFYGMILFISTLILFAFPLGEMLFDNDQYSNISTLRDNDDLKELDIYTTEFPLFLSPEYVYHFGEPVTHAFEARSLPQQKKFGLLVRDTIPVYVKNHFDFTFRHRYDINYRKKETGDYSPRKVMKLYILEKKE